MKLLIDEQIPKSVDDALRKKNHLVKRVKKGNSDANILKQAKDGARTLLTMDKDFKKLAPQKGTPPKGIIRFTGAAGLKGEALTKFIIAEVEKIKNPGAQVYEVSGAKQNANPKTPSPKPAVASAAQVAKVLIQGLTLGNFRSPKCQKIIAKQFPTHPMSKMSGAEFGSAFKESIWPEIAKRGGKLRRPSPARYEMTQAAKDSVK